MSNSFLIVSTYANCDTLVLSTFIENPPSCRNKRLNLSSFVDHQQFHLPVRHHLQNKSVSLECLVIFKPALHVDVWCEIKACGELRQWLGIEDIVKVVQRNRCNRMNMI